MEVSAKALCSVPILVGVEEESVNGIIRITEKEGDSRNVNI